MPPRTAPIRIVVVAPAYAPFVGGAEKHLQAVAERLILRGYDVTVVTLDVRQPHDFGGTTVPGLPGRETVNGVQVIRVSARRSGLHGLLTWMYRQPGGFRLTAAVFGKAFAYWFTEVDTWRMRAPLHALPADVIISNAWYYGTTWWADEAATARGIPHIGNPLLHVAMPWAQNPLFPGMLARSAATLVLTEAEGEFAVAHGARNVVVSGSGVDPEQYDARDGTAIRQRLGLTNETIVGYVGRQDRDKGVPTLIDAMQLVWQERPDAVLLIAGSSMRRDAETTARLAALSPDERSRVHLVDDFDESDKASIIDACDLLALPSVEDAFGIVLTEAWMCGKPVIAGDIPSSRCIVDPGLDGWLVKIFDPRDLADRIEQLLASPALRAEFGARGRAKVLARWTWDRVTDEWEKAITLALQPR